MVGYEVSKKAILIPPPAARAALIGCKEQCVSRKHISHHPRRSAIIPEKIESRDSNSRVRDQEERKSGGSNENPLCRSQHVDLYKDDLPSPQLFFAEFERWKMKVQARIITADSCAASLKACDPDDFPKPVHSSQDCNYSSRDIARVRAFNQHSEKAKQLHEMYHGRE